MKRALPLVLVACAAEPDPPASRTVTVFEIRVDISVEPDPGSIQVEQPAWLRMDHCGQLSIDGETLIARGGLPPHTQAVALVRYPGWGGIFSGGGTEELELDITEGATLYAALDVDRPLYDLFPDLPDTGVPGGERTHQYAPRDLPGDLTAVERHTRLPIRELVVEEAEPMACAR